MDQGGQPTNLQNVELHAVDLRVNGVPAKKGWVAGVGMSDAKETLDLHRGIA
jgi:hypothetical protein